MTTQYASASYQEVIDLHTESDRVSVVGIHTPNSDTPYHMLKGFWTQFKKFKYNGCSISLVPAAQLPADPLQVSYESGEPTIDPRDMLNPILFHGCHGDDMGAILNSLYNEDSSASFINMMQSDSADLNVFPRSVISGLGDTEVYEALYYKAMTDKTWLKAHPQRGFRKSGLRPMVYSVASMHQFASNGGNEGQLGGSLGQIDTAHISTGSEVSLRGSSMGTGNSSGVYASGIYDRPSANVSNNTFNLTTANHLGFVTPRLQRLGWLDTRMVTGITSGANISLPVGGASTGSTLAAMYRNASTNLRPTMVPKIFMGMIMLPPAYKTEQYFRLIINHSFSFGKFRGASMLYDDVGTVKDAYSVFDFNEMDESKRKIEPDEKGGVDDVPEDK